MKKRLVIAGMLISVAACAQDQTPVPDSATQAEQTAALDPLKNTKPLTPEAKHALGIENNTDMVVVFHADGTSTLYYDEGKGFQEGDANALKGRTLIDGYQVLITTSSPGCYSYTSWTGQTMWYPSPPCPGQ